MRKIFIVILSCFYVLSYSAVYAQETGEAVQETAQEQAETGQEIETSSESEPVEKSAEDLSGTAQVEIIIAEGSKPTKEYVQKAWELSTQGKLQELDDLVVEVLAAYETQAKALQAPLDAFPTTAQQPEYQVLNDVATVLFVQAEAMMNYGKRDEAIAAFEALIEEYPWAKSWDPRGWYWSIKEKSQASIDVMTGNVKEEEEHIPERIKTVPKLAFPGTEDVIDYGEYGEFQNVGTSNYHYKTERQKELIQAVGEGIYPNTSSVYKNPAYRKAKKEGRLDGSHWDFVRTDDLEAAFFKWATAHEPWGVRLFYLGMIFEKAGMHYEALKAYHAIVVHFPKVVAWTNWNTPWYPAQAAIGKIKHIIRFHPELNLDVRWMSIQVKNGYDNDVANDVISTYPGVISKRTFWDNIKEKLSIGQKTVELGAPVKVVGQGKVQLKKYENGHWQMFVDGEPYIIKGVTYTPTKIGQSPDKGTLVSWMYEDTNDNGRPDLQILL